MSHYNDAIQSLLNNNPELAILQIRQGLYEQRKAEYAKEIEAFELQPDVSEYKRPTDFLPFQGWESA
jgi:hypothetical protein